MIDRLKEQFDEDSEEEEEEEEIRSWQRSCRGHGLQSWSEKENRGRHATKRVVDRPAAATNPRGVEELYLRGLVPRRYSCITSYCWPTNMGARENHSTWIAHHLPPQGIADMHSRSFQCCRRLDNKLKHTWWPVWLGQPARSVHLHSFFIMDPSKCNGTQRGSKYHSHARAEQSRAWKIRRETSDLQDEMESFSGSAKWVNDHQLEQLAIWPMNFRMRGPTPSRASFAWRGLWRKCVIQGRGQRTEFDGRYLCNFLTAIWTLGHHQH